MNHQEPSRKVLRAMLVALLLAGCASPAATPTRIRSPATPIPVPPTAAPATLTPKVLATRTQSVGPEGGTIAMDSGVRLVFPVGAVAQNIDVRVTQLDPSSYLDEQSEGVLLDCTAPMTKFQQNIEFRIPLPRWYTPEQADTVIAGTMDDRSAAILSEPVAIQMVDGKPELVVQGDHFSLRIFRWLRENYGYPPPSAGPLDIPYYSQGSTDFCTAAALQMVAEAARHAEIGEVYNIVGALRLDPSGLSPEEAVDSPTVGDTMFARTLKRPERIYWRLGTQSGLRSYIRRQIAFLKRPVVLVSATTGVEHSFVIVGYDGTDFAVHDPQGMEGDVYKWMPSASLGLETSWDENATIVVPAVLSADRPLVTVNIMDASLEFASPRERFQFRWDYAVPEGYSFRTGDTAPPVATIPGNVTELRLVFAGGGIEIANAYQAGGARRVSVWIDVKGRGPNNTGYSDRTEVIVEPLRVARVQFKPIAVDQFRDPAPTPSEYVFTVTVLVEGRIVDSASLRFVMEPAGTTTPTHTPTSAPTPTATATSTPAASTLGEWVLESIIPTTRLNPDWPDGSYTDNRVSIGDGSFSSSDAWKDRLHSGSRQIICSWTSPPSYLKVDDTLSMSALCQTTDQRNGGGASAGGGGGLYLTLNPDKDNLGGYFTWSQNIFRRDCVANTGGNETSASDAKSGAIKIPGGKLGDVLVIVGSWHGTGGSGRTVYKYVYGSTNPPPARSNPSPSTPAPAHTDTVTLIPTATPTMTPTAVRTIAPATTSTPTELSSAVEEIFRVFSIGVANNGATKPTSFTITESWLVTSIHTYHWNNGRGATPGTIGLRASNGTIYGPWKAAGEPGQGGVANAFWVVNPNIVIPRDTYTVLDSDPSTWAQNQETGGAGMAWGLGIRRGNP